MKQLLIVLVAAACGGGDPVKLPQDIAKEYGPRLFPRMDAIVAAGKIANEHQTSLGAAGSGPTDLVVHSDERAGNTLIVHAEDLDDLKTDAKPPLRFLELRHDPFRTAKSWTGAKVGLQAGDFRIFEDELQRVIDSKYVLVVIPTAYTRPDMGIGTTYAPGSAEATVVLVELDGAKPLGGVRVTARNRDELTTRWRPSGTGAFEQRQRELEADLAYQLSQAISTAIRARWKNAQAPSTWVYGY